MPLLELVLDSSWAQHCIENGGVVFENYRRDRKNAVAAHDAQRLPDVKIGII